MRLNEVELNEVGKFLPRIFSKLGEMFSLQQCLLLMSPLTHFLPQAQLVPIIVYWLRVVTSL